MLFGETLGLKKYYFQVLTCIEYATEQAEERTIQKSLSLIPS